MTCQRVRGGKYSVTQTLNELEQRATVANQELRAAVARVEQARASARVARSEFLPTLDANPSYSRERYSPNQEPKFWAARPD